MAKVTPTLGGLSCMVTNYVLTKYLAMISSKFCCHTYLAVITFGGDSILNLNEEIRWLFCLLCEVKLKISP